MRREIPMPDFDIQDTFHKGIDFTNLSFAEDGAGGLFMKQISIDIKNMSREDKSKFLSDFDTNAKVKMKNVFGEYTSSIGTISKAKKTLYENNFIDSDKLQTIGYMDRIGSYGQKADDMYRNFSMGILDTKSYRQPHSANVEGILTEVLEESIKKYGVTI